LIQTIGRAARNVSGQVHMYADSITPSMRQAIDETNRRRAKQVAFNSEHGIDPQPLRKRIADITDLLVREEEDTKELIGSSGTSTPIPTRRTASMAEGELVQLIEQLTNQMHQAASDLQFELAARLRDEVSELKTELRSMREAIG